MPEFHSVGIYVGKHEQLSGSRKFAIGLPFTPLQLPLFTK